MVSIGIFALVVVLVNVLLVNVSPIDGRPCDELECGPCVVFVAQRLVFEFQKRLIAADTCKMDSELFLVIL